MGALNGWLSLFWVVGILLLVWLGAVGTAPMIQRNEARNECRDLRQRLAPNEAQWVSVEMALQYLYDELTSGRFRDQGQILQATKSLGGQSENLWDHVGAWLVDGIKSGKIVARGIREMRSRLERVPRSISDNPWDGDLAHKAVLDDDGIKWSLKEINQPSVREYLVGLS
ncbi:hypothetical protein [Roseovarius indicus]|nr:hypothetical protein [Roseovarius indicus]